MTQIRQFLSSEQLAMSAERKNERRFLCKVKAIHCEMKGDSLKEQKMAFLSRYTASANEVYLHWLEKIS